MPSLLPLARAQGRRFNAMGAATARRANESRPLRRAKRCTQQMQAARLPDTTVTSGPLAAKATSHSEGRDALVHSIANAPLIRKRLLRVGTQLLVYEHAI